MLSRIPTGFKEIDSQLGGIAPRTILRNEGLNGDVAVGKTLLSLAIANRNLPVLIYDLEQNFFPCVFEQYNVDASQVIIARVSDPAIAYALADDVKLVVIDSISAAENPGELMRELVLTNLPMLVISQLRHRPFSRDYSTDEVLVEGSCLGSLEVSSQKLVRRGARRVGRIVSMRYTDWYGRAPTTVWLTRRFYFTA